MVSRTIRFIQALTVVLFVNTGKSYQYCLWILKSLRHMHTLKSSQIHMNKYVGEAVTCKQNWMSDIAANKFYAYTHKIHQHPVCDASVLSPNVSFPLLSVHTNCTNTCSWKQLLSPPTLAQSMLLRTKDPLLYYSLSIIWNLSKFFFTYITLRPSPLTVSKSRARSAHGITLIN